MKNRFSTVDLIAALSELRQKLVGMRLNQVYDIDTKSYLMRFARQEEKAMLLLESGIRIHTTEFEWPKNTSPSGFSMKMRKHLKNKRLESITQLGVDRIVDLQFGINEAAYHVILELYDRGNIVLTDHEYLIQNILRPRATGSEDVKFVVRETYPIQAAKQKEDSLTMKQLTELFETAKPNENIKKLLNPKLSCGPAILEHVLLSVGIAASSSVGKELTIEKDVPTIFKALGLAEAILTEAAQKPCQGFIIQKLNKMSTTLPVQNQEKETLTYDEFHPFLFQQHQSGHYIECETFNKAVDIFFSSIEGQKIDIKMMHKEREALKKLENVKKDHEKRMSNLQKSQFSDVEKAQMIEMNLPLIDNAILVIRSAIANQIPWSEIWNIIKEAQSMGDPVARSICELKLDTNHFTIKLKDPFEVPNADDPSKTPMQVVDIDLDLSAYANARKYYDKKRQAAKKEQKTLESSERAYKNAEKKTKQTLKEVAVKSTIMKARKTFWFEKFLWFISSENYLIIAGRDIPQNELIVKRYLKPGDVYVHADLHGASSVVIKNPSGQPIPPKTQNEAGTMSVCYSAAWEAKVVTSAWWVYHYQVSKTAPSGEYLTPGSFMIRGKKNYLPASHLIMGFGFIFKLDEESLERHAGERAISQTELPVVEDAQEEIELPIEDDDDGETFKDAPVENLVEEKVLDKVEDVEENESSDENESSLFPDTVVRVERWPSESEGATKLDEPSPTDDAKGVKSKPKKEKKKRDNSPTNDTPPDSSKPQSKRGQKSKAKKMKEKYKDQDDEERQLRMEILGSAGTPKEPTFKGKKGKKAKENLVRNATSQNQQKPKVQLLSSVILHDETEVAEVEANTPAQEIVAKTSGELEDDNGEGQQSDDEQDDAAQVSDELKILDSLTGCPVVEDGLLFAVPVCAPYAALQNFKFKVKVTPGTGKRGKAAKTALNTFLRDKTAISREKDLLKSVKDQDISRNLPGKVKLSAPNLVKLKK